MQERLRAKLAEQVASNDASVKGKQEVHPDPTDRQPGSIHAKWGDRPALDSDGYPSDHASGVVQEGNKDRRGVLEALFEDMGAASTADQALVNQYFSTPSGERRPAHSPLLQKEGEAHRKEALTLREQIHGILGG